MSEKEQKVCEEEMLDWVDALELDVRVDNSLIEAVGIADVNLRIAVDAISNVYLLDWARSEREFRKAARVST